VNSKSGKFMEDYSVYQLSDLNMQVKESDKEADNEANSRHAFD
jgi:hypothetical protein